MAMVLLESFGNDSLFEFPLSSTSLDSDFVIAHINPLSFMDSYD